MKLHIALFAASSALMVFPSTASADWWSKGNTTKDTNNSSDWWGKSKTAKNSVKDAVEKNLTKISAENSDSAIQKDSEVAIKVDTKNTVENDANSIATKVTTEKNTQNTIKNTTVASNNAPVAPVINNSISANISATPTAQTNSISKTAEDTAKNVKVQIEQPAKTTNNKKADANILFQGTGTTDKATALKLKRMVESKEIPNAKVNDGTGHAVNTNSNGSWNMNMPSAGFNQQMIQQPMPQAMTYIPLRVLAAQGYVPQIQVPQMWGQIPQFNMQQRQQAAPANAPSFEQQQAMMDQMRIQFETMALSIAERQKAAVISYQKYQSSQKQSANNTAPENASAPVTPEKSAKAPTATTATTESAPQVPSTPTEKAN